jgi:hypothetical protein
MIRAIIAGPDRGLESALSALGVEVTRIDDVVTGASLEAAAVTEATLLLLTDPDEATAVPIAKDLNPAIRTVFYTPDSLPEFIKGQLDLAIDPALLDATAVAEELVGSIED